MKSCISPPVFTFKKVLRSSPKGGFFSAKSGCVLYADATYTRVYTFQDDLKFTKHLTDKVKKANSILGLIHHGFQHIDNEMHIHLYKALVCSHVEYASSVWSPFKLRDIKLIGVQRRATRLSRDFWNEPYNIRLTTLGLPMVPTLST